VKAAIVLLLLTGVAFPLLVGYHVDPVKAQWSGWALGDENHGVAEILTCNFDEVVYCELFAGETLTGQNYKVDVYELPGDTVRVAYNNGEHATQPQAWVHMPLTTEPGESFTKGRQYEFKFTRSGSDSIQYYWAEGDKYRWGELMRAEVPYARFIGDANRYRQVRRRLGLPCGLGRSSRPVLSSTCRVNASLPSGLPVLVYSFSRATFSVSSSAFSQSDQFSMPDSRPCRSESSESTLRPVCPAALLHG
jgi:hypothetical protein